MAKRRKPKYQVQWEEKVDPWKKMIGHRPTLFAGIPEEHWDDVTAIINGHEGGIPIDVHAREEKLKRLGVMDEYGQFFGDPNFGHSPFEDTPAMHYDACKFDNVENGIVVDLAMPTPQEGRKLWGRRYIVREDGSHGPAAFGSRAEKMSYLKATGHQERGGYSH